MTDLCPLCGAEVGPGHDAWLHLHEAHGGGASARRPEDGGTAEAPAGEAGSPDQNPSGRSRAPRAERGPSVDPKNHGRAVWRETYAAAPATMTIIALTIAVWLVHEALFGLGINSDLTLGGTGTFGDHNQWWRIITPVVVHFGALHLLFNMLWLYQLGPAVERIMGRWLFLLSYVATGVAGNVASDIVYYHRANMLSGGASGAVYGVIGILVGAYAVARYIERHDPSPSRPGSLQFNGEAVRSLAIVFGVFLVIGNLIGPVDTAAHIGGVVVGLLIGAVLAWVRNGPRAAPVDGSAPGPYPGAQPGSG